MSNIKISVGLGSCGIAAGADKVYAKIDELNKSGSIDVNLNITSCIGMCYKEPLVEISVGNQKFLYGEVDEKNLEKLITEHVKNGKVLTKLLVNADNFETAESDFFCSQTKIALRNCGRINPEVIEDYLDNEGYYAIRKIFKNGLTGKEIIDIITRSGLRGRGGGGFSTGLKWSFAYEKKSPEKYIICNADEGDPGAFMDRSLLEGDPHSVIEGMIIAALAIKAIKGFIYVRAEYPLAIKRLKIALEQAKQKGFLGQNIFSSDTSFDIEIFQGAGAFVCGEETALIRSVGGKRGTPSHRPPFPAESGLWGNPTIVNNVETLANVPYIILQGAEEFCKYGTVNSRGTKVFALAGNIKRGGLVEVPMGISINDIIFKIGGGIPGKKKFKAVQLGGPSGGCLPAEYGDTGIDYESLQKSGAIMGSGGMVVMDEATCMVDIAKYFLDFTCKESCGECAPCRLGTKQMLDILNDIVSGKAEEKDLDLLMDLALSIKKTSFCGLGQTAPNPVITTLKYFKEEYLEHINKKMCRAKKCRVLLRYYINSEKCTGCRICYKFCPVNAIVGQAKSPHEIIQEKCTKCGICKEKCPDKFDAVMIETGN